MITAQCPNCNYQVRGDERYAGQVVGCPKCKKPFRMPEAWFEEVLTNPEVVDKSKPPPLPEQDGDALGFLSAAAQPVHAHRPPPVPSGPVQPPSVQEDGLSFLSAESSSRSPSSYSGHRPYVLKRKRKTATTFYIAGGGILLTAVVGITVHMVTHSSSLFQASLVKTKEPSAEVSGEIRVAIPDNPRKPISNLSVALLPITPEMVTSVKNAAQRSEELENAYDLFASANPRPEYGSPQYESWRNQCERARGLNDGGEAWPLRAVVPGLVKRALYTTLTDANGRFGFKVSKGSYLLVTDRATLGEVTWVWLTLVTVKESPSSPISFDPSNATFPGLFLLAKRVLA